MGCITSQPGEDDDCLIYSVKSMMRGGYTNDSTISNLNVNDNEIDITHFSVSKCIIGLGGFGLVRKVSKISGIDNGKMYALKSLSKRSVIDRSSGAASVMTELRILSLLRGTEHICNVHYAFQDANYLYLIMDFASGGDLRNKLRSVGHFNESVSRKYLFQLALAVSHCHEAGILHRDIKPENILIGVTGDLMLTDFGVSKLLYEDINNCRSTSGTHGYMAPEVYRHGHLHGTAADWFSVGVTLHEMLMGRRPFEAGRLQAFRSSRVMDGLYPSYLIEHGHSLSTACKQFVCGLLAVNTENRLGSVCGVQELISHRWFLHFDPHAPCKAPMMACGFDFNNEPDRAAILKHLCCPAMEPISPSSQAKFVEYSFRSSTGRHEFSTSQYSHEVRSPFVGGALRNDRPCTQQAMTPSPPPPPPVLESTRFRSATFDNPSLLSMSAWVKHILSSASLHNNSTADELTVRRASSLVEDGQRINSCRIEVCCSKQSF